MKTTNTARYSEWTIRELHLELSRRMALVKGDWRASLKSTTDEYAHALADEIRRRNAIGCS